MRDGRDEPDVFVAVVAYVVHIADAIALSWQIARGLHDPLYKGPTAGSVRHLRVIPLAYDLVVLEWFKDASEAKVQASTAAIARDGPIHSHNVTRTLRCDGEGNWR